MNLSKNYENQKQIKFSDTLMRWISSIEMTGDLFCCIGWQLCQLASQISESFSLESIKVIIYEESDHEKVFKLEYSPPFQVIHRQPSASRASSSSFLSKYKNKNNNLKNEEKQSDQKVNDYKIKIDNSKLIENITNEGSSFIKQCNQQKLVDSSVSSQNNYQIKFNQQENCQVKDEKESVYSYLNRLINTLDNHKTLNTSIVKSLVDCLIQISNINKLTFPALLRFRMIRLFFDRGFKDQVSKKVQHLIIVLWTIYKKQINVSIQFITILFQIALKKYPNYASLQERFELNMSTEKYLGKIHQKFVNFTQTLETDPHDLHKNYFNDNNEGTLENQQCIEHQLLINISLRQIKKCVTEQICKHIFQSNLLTAFLLAVSSPNNIEAISSISQFFLLNKKNKLALYFGEEALLIPFQILEQIPPFLDEQKNKDVNISQIDSHDNHVYLSPLSANDKEEKSQIQINCERETSFALGFIFQSKLESLQATKCFQRARKLNHPNAAQALLFYARRYSDLEETETLFREALGNHQINLPYSPWQFCKNEISQLLYM